MCGSGCLRIDRSAFRPFSPSCLLPAGPWKPPQIDNPDYKGEWVHPEIDNPEYKPDDSLYKFEDFGIIGFDLWQVHIPRECLAS